MALLSAVVLPVGAGAGLVFFLRSAMPRRRPGVPHRQLWAWTRDGVRIAVTHLPRRDGGEAGAAMVLAHPAVTGQRYAPLVGLAEEMARSFDVFTFDFRGHGRSGGVLDFALGLEAPAADLEAVLGMVRERAYRWVGVAGFSLGGMAAFSLAAKRPRLMDALAVVGMPPRFPELKPYRGWLPLWFLLLRGLGARFRGSCIGGPAPVDLALAFPRDLPLLVVHGGREIFFPEEDLCRLMDLLGEKAELLVVREAGHAELGSGRERFIDWFVERCEQALGAR